MLKNICNTLLLFTLLIPFTVNAQLASDALRYSQQDLGGTARTLGIGGAIGALGADFSALSSNPAGIATFRRTDFTFSTELYNARATSQLEGSDLPIGEFDSKININNAGIVIASHRPTRQGWKTINFGIGFNRMANFNQVFFYQGETPGSITGRFVELADGSTPDQLDDFEAGPAFDAGAIFNAQGFDNTFYFKDIMDDEVIDKSQLVRQSGGVNEFVMSFGGNYEEKLMVGATLGIPFVNFSEDKIYTEQDEEDLNPVFTELNFRENLRTTGTGINLKLGAIYRPFQALRIGAAVHSPTRYNLDDEYNTSIDYAFEFSGSQSFEADSPSGFYEYRIRTPWRFQGSTAFLFGKNGFISAEVEYVDYSTASFDFNNATDTEDATYERELNQEIQQNYQGAVTARLGAEARYKVFRFRAGYNLGTSPFVDDTNLSSAITLGAGIRQENFYLDLGYRRSAFGETYIPYTTTAVPQPEVTNDFVFQRFLATFGFKF